MLAVASFAVVLGKFVVVFSGVKIVSGASVDIMVVSSATPIRLASDIVEVSERVAVVVSTGKAVVLTIFLTVSWASTLALISFAVIVGNSVIIFIVEVIASGASVNVVVVISSATFVALVSDIDEASGTLAVVVSTGTAVVLTSSLTAFSMLTAFVAVIGNPEVTSVGLAVVWRAFVVSIFVEPIALVIPASNTAEVSKTFAIVVAASDVFSAGLMKQHQPP